jgi:membrane-bound ClpP family serine protease
MRFMLRRREANVLLIVGIVLLVLWLLGLGSAYTLGGFVYVLLVLGLILVVISLFARFRGHR